MDSVTVTVKTLDGHSLDVEVPLSGTVKDVRSQLKQQYGLAKCGLYLQVRAQLLSGASSTQELQQWQQQCCLLSWGRGRSEFYCAAAMSSAGCG
jgi:hypothetical protein